MRRAFVDKFKPSSDFKELKCYMIILGRPRSRHFVQTCLTWRISILKILGSAGPELEINQSFDIQTVVHWILRSRVGDTIY
jgi:hypothetical protein